ncbi:MAG TPA: TIGR03435 family protein [Acidobacteriaceae bacterium]|nr:TIGR03435 family protein [Acidobacteriaceae bacterium]
MRAALAGIAIGIAPLCTAAQASRSFEVATIKPVARCTAPIVATFTQSGRLNVGCQPLVILIRLAYFPRVQEGDVTGGPKWSQTDLYDLVAKVDDADMAGWNRMNYREQLKVVQPLLQQLLADRFKLKAHTDTRMIQAYALGQAKGGAKLKEVPPPDQHNQIVGDAAPKSTDPPVGGFRIVNNRMIARAVQIPDLLWFFAARSGYEDAPAVDRTGLDGYYDFEMKLPDFNDKAEFERQMSEQLGLRIQQQKVPLPTIVIDQAERPSLDN